jgi:hypothetical protein
LGSFFPGDPSPSCRSSGYCPGNRSSWSFCAVWVGRSEPYQVGLLGLSWRSWVHSARLLSGSWVRSARLLVGSLVRSARVSARFLGSFGAAVGEVLGFVRRGRRRGPWVRFPPARKPATPNSLGDSWSRPIRPVRWVGRLARRQPLTLVASRAILDDSGSPGYNPLIGRGVAQSSRARKNSVG